MRVQASSHTAHIMSPSHTIHDTYIPNLWENILRTYVLLLCRKSKRLLCRIVQNIYLLRRSIKTSAPRDVTPTTTTPIVLEGRIKVRGCRGRTRWLWRRTKRATQFRCYSVPAAGTSIYFSILLSVCTYLFLGFKVPVFGRFLLFKSESSQKHPCFHSA